MGNCGNLCGEILVPIQRMIYYTNGHKKNSLIYEGIEGITDIPINRVSHEIQQEIVYINSYNAQNNFFTVLKKIVRLQRDIKLFLKRKKERKKKNQSNI